MPIDYKRYPADWKERVKRIKERDGDTCQFCGLENGQEVYSMSIPVRTPAARYQNRAIWFSSELDALRFSNALHFDYCLEAPMRKGRYKAVKVVLTVAHLDHDEENHDVSDDRLAALCQYCHLSYDAKEKFRRAVNNERPSQRKGCVA